MTLNALIEEIPRIGPAYIKKLNKLGIKKVSDLLFHFPHRYDDFTNIISINKVKAGETATIQGKILEIKNSRTWKKRIVITEALIEDGTGAIRVIWFNQPFLVNNLKPGQIVSLSGKVSFTNEGLYLSSPAYEKVSSFKFQVSSLAHTARLVPVYPETEGLSSRWLRYILKPLLEKIIPELKDFLPPEIKKRQKILDLSLALWQIHFPKNKKMAELSRQRFAFEELFLIQLERLQTKKRLQREKAPQVLQNIQLIKEFSANLPFKLTDAQRKATWEIIQDLKKSYPMSRLLEGDVGSGKTVVAVMAALNTISAGWQVAFMAPTEILAQQHFQEISKLLKNFKITIGLLTGKESKIKKTKLKDLKREEFLKQILDPITLKKYNGASKKIDLVIGTHALIQEKVKFKNLGMVIIDEQHRFGTEQRAKLASSNQKQETRTIPHLLSMTATPIPRSLALTVYGDLDLSLLDEMPKGRQKIITKIVPPTARKETYDFIKKEVEKGRQIFVICPRIEKSQITNHKSFTPLDSKHLTGQANYKSQITNKEMLSWSEVKAVKEEYKKLSKEIFPDLKVEMLHGKMKSKEKEKIMKNFKKKKSDILVSTSVIEVGIDVPNATIMMIEGADRFGLAQLHQFRGRVGRGLHQSYCFLLTDSPAKKTYQRLKAILTCENGFELAEKDLKIRGPGDFFGTRQSGIPDFTMRNLSDLPLIKKVRQEANLILEKEPNLEKYPLLLEKLKEFKKRVHLE